MKVKVLRRFRDKETMQIRERGAVIEVSEKRAKEILAAGDYIEVVENTKGRTTKKSVTPQNDETAQDVESVTPQNQETEHEEKAVDEMTVAEMKEYAEKNGIDLSNARKKAEILEAIQTAER